MEHVLKNKSGIIPGGEFPGIDDAVSYVKRAREFLDRSDPDVISWTSGGKRHVFDKTAGRHHFAVEDLPSGGSGSGIIKTFFHSNLKDKHGNLLTPYEWVKKRGYSGPAF